MNARHLSNRQYGMLLSIPGLVVLFAWVMIPLFYVILLSFLRYDNISPVQFSGLANYKYVISNPDFPKILANTFKFAIGSTGLTLLVSVILAASLNRINIGSIFFRSLVIMPWAVPLILSGFLWAWLFHPSYGPISDIAMRLGIAKEGLNIYKDPTLSMMGVIIADAWRRIPFVTIVSLAAFQSIDQELYDAAKVDGADTIDIFTRITIPLSIRPIMTATLITLMFTFRSIDVIYAMTPGGGYAKSTYVLGAFLFDMLYEFLNFGVAASISVLFMLFSSLLGALFIYFTLKR